MSKGLSDPDEPAIAVRDLTGVLQAWIEIGQPDAARLHKAGEGGPGCRGLHASWPGCRCSRASPASGFIVPRELRLRAVDVESAGRAGHPA